MAAAAIKQYAEFDYERYLRVRSLNSILCRMVPWAFGWLSIGVVVAVVGYSTRPNAAVIGLDPVGRAYSLQIIGEAAPKGPKQ